MRPVHIIVSCEHAGNRVPKAYEYLFDCNPSVLETHRGLDIGAFSIAQTFSDHLRAKLFETNISRLLIDCNRSVENSELFSEYSRPLKNLVKKYLIEHYYLPYRKKVEAYISNHCRKKPVLHLSIHTFTPVWHGEERLVDIGFLFDESRDQEKKLCATWQETANLSLNDKLVMLNVPYNGAADGFTTYLRKEFGENEYMGIEVEINQKWVGTVDLKQVISALLESLDQTLDKIMGTELMDL